MFIESFLYFCAQKQNQMKALQSFLMRAVIALLVGVIVIMYREDSLIYILATILIIGAVNQFVNLGIASKDGKICFAWWILPALLLGIGIYILAKRIEPVTTELYIIGWCMLVYGIMECTIALKVHSVEKQKAIEEAEKQKAAEEAARQKLLEETD